MKLWIFIPVIVLFFFQCPQVMAQQESLLLTQSEFMALTFSEQKHYIKNLRGIFVEMNENNPHLAAELAKRSSLFVALWGAGVPSVSAENSEAPKGVALEKQTEDFIRQYMENSRQYSLEILQKVPLDLTPEDKKRLDAYLNQALISAKYASHWNDKYLKNPALKQTLKATVVDPTVRILEQAQIRMKNIYPEGSVTKTSDTELGQVKQAELGTNRLDQAPSLYVDYEKRENILLAATTPTKERTDKSKTTKKATQSKTEGEREVAEVFNKMYYRCMYAGFVIKSDPCVAPKKVPWNLTGINLDKFECTQDTVMCNPLLFGVNVSSCDWKSAKENPDKIKECLLESKPFCTPRDSAATKNCAKLSNTDVALETAVYLNKNSKDNEKVFAEFGTQFTQLCDEKMINYNNYGKKRRSTSSRETIRRDIEVTCENARKRLKEVTSTYRSIKDSLKKQDASSQKGAH